MTDWEKNRIAVDHLVGFERPDDTSKLDDRGVICLTMYGEGMLPFKHINRMNYNNWRGSCFKRTIEYCR